MLRYPIYSVVVVEFCHIPGTPRFMELPERGSFRPLSDVFGVEGSGWVTLQCTTGYNEVNVPGRASRRKRGTR